MKTNLIEEEVGHILFVEEGYRRSARAIKKAHDLGFQVSLVSSLPSRYSTNILSHSRVANPFDVEKTLAAALEINSSSPIDGVVTLMERLPSVAAITSKLNLPGLSIKSAYISQNKYRCRQILKDAGLEQTKFKYLDVRCGAEEIFNAIGEIGYPCVLKPVGGAGGGGVFILRSQSEAKIASKAILKMSKSKVNTFGYFQNEAIVEELVLGRQFSMEGYVSGSESRLVAVTEKYIEEDKIEAMHIVPAGIDRQALMDAASFFDRTVSALDLNDTMMHIEAVLGSDGWQLIEVNARLGGGCICTDLVPIAYDFDMVETMCRIAIGKQITSNTRRTSKFAASTLFRGEFPGHVISIEGESEALKVPGVVDVVMENAVLEILNLEFLPGDDRLGAVITSGLSAEECINIGKTAANKICVHISPTS